MRTADFKRNNQAIAPANGGSNSKPVLNNVAMATVGSKQSNKTPGFLLSPRTNSLANSISANQHSSLLNINDQNQIQVNDQTGKGDYDDSSQKHSSNSHGHGKMMH